MYSTNSALYKVISNIFYLTKYANTIQYFILILIGSSKWQKDSNTKNINSEVIYGILLVL